MSYIRSLIQAVTPSIVINGYFAVKNYFSRPTPTTSSVTTELLETEEMAPKASPLATAATNFAADTGRDIAFNAARLGVMHAADYVAPGASALTGAAVNMAFNGTQAALEGEDVRKAVARSAASAVTAVAMGPIPAALLSPATNYVANKAVDLYDVGGITNAYTNYKNHAEWAAMPYRKNWGAPLQQDEISITEEDLDINESFMLMSPAA
ncbi:hypothetical protein [Candidatus Berkiella aquae]|uniref:Uncharacterized protein n=1 Tax=Candidatus Berkiella aquae TaxID=295108 RepID=A0A0Q9YYM4_9GAMM|nr:hypothetical protein [Candidatus Berkiella aquae]MCS5710851.1 hypothetical protein [Candidatus Berkiella aquae]